MSRETLLTCPLCGSTEVESTTMGGTLTDGRYDDWNRATCAKCKHRGTVGDWERLADLRAYKERTEAELRIRCHHLSVYEMAGDAAQRVFARSEIDEYKVAGLWRDPPAEGEVKP